jgi:iron(III) transport system ATP-binding protein
MMLQINNISRYKINRQVLKCISLIVNKSEIIGLAGETGSGKSTLLHIIGGLESRDEGDIVFDNQLLPSPEVLLIPGYDQMAYMSQSTSLMNHYRVHEMLEYKGRLNSSAVAEIIDVCKIGHLLQRWTHELSGGEKQRVALAFCMTADPKVLLLDEPFSHLDRPQKIQLSNVLKVLNDRRGITIILASHDPEELMSLCDKIAVIKEGSILQYDTPENVYTKPTDTYCAGLLGDFSILDVSNLSLPNFIPDPKASSKSKILIRPSNLIFTDVQKADFSGNVIQSVYSGNYFQTTVHTEAGDCMIHSPHQLQPGTQIHLKLNPKPIHFL